MAEAGAALSTTGGCSAWGMSYILSPTESYTKTDATQTGGCANTYLIAWFYDGTSWNYFPVSWVSGSVAIHVFHDFASQVNGTHNLCSGTPPCGSWWQTSAP